MIELHRLHAVALDTADQGVDALAGIEHGTDGHRRQEHPWCGVESSTSGGRPATVMPKTTSVRPVADEIASARAAVTTALSVTPR